jgi:probable F420-dependent oxidoreductase
MSERAGGAAELREAIGRVGVWVTPAALDPDPGAFAAQQEQLGYGALWVGGGNADAAAFDQLEKALAGSTRIVLATGIANIWAWEPAALGARAAALEAAYPGRFVLGLGVSHAPLVEGLGHRYEQPYQAMVDFLDGLDSAGPASAAPPRVLAALGKRMLGLAGDRAAGAHPYLTPPAHTAIAREVLGVAPVLAPEQALVVDEDDDRARDTARAYLGRYLKLPNYRSNLERLGYGDEDFAGTGSDRLVDLLLPHGAPEQVAVRVRAQLEAGADHVCIQPLANGGGLDADALASLAPLLIGK